MKPTGNPAAVFIKAAKAFDEDRHFDDLELLEGYLELRTIDAEGTDADGALVIAEDHPGYLVREVATERVFVPFNLASVSPSQTDFEAAIAIGKSIRISETGAFCLSGSSTFLGRLAVGGDLDFSEYRLDVNAHIAAAVKAKAEIAEPSLIWVKVGEHQLKTPWSDLTVHLAPPVERLKLDFVSRSPLGVLPTTSVILATNDGEDLAAHQSFAYQEAVILGGPVRLLHRPDRLGAYVSWLKREVRSILDGGGHYVGMGAPIKALKRCLSLLMMLEQPDEVEDILNELRDSVLGDIVLDARLDELERMKADMASTPEWLTAEIAALRSRASFGEDQREAAVTRAMDAAKDLYEVIETLFEDAA